MVKLDLNSDDEKANIETIFWSAMDMLSDDDKKLPQASSFPFSPSKFGIIYLSFLKIDADKSCYCQALQISNL